ncbi:neutral zinc metallopeptidase [Sphaerisporangium aureirubrum]|uniref:Metalloprotease n=1 Tax=Sphaerisporangium aureirubrum TaxID=1544736 RepID=A0ABW1NKE6_9ACTN
MRTKLTIIVVAGLLGSLFLSGAEASAGAYPVRDAPVLTSNKLYKSGVLPRFSCKQGALSTENTKAAVKTLKALWGCLNKGWGAYFGKAGLDFKPAKLTVITKGRRFCGDKWEKTQAASYCEENSTAAILADKYYLKVREIYHFQLAASLYGRHVQELTGIGDGFQTVDYSTRPELNELYRRYSLQAYCLGGVFLGAVWKTAARDAESWPALLDLMRINGDEGKKPGKEGRGKSIVRWLDRGYKSRNPRSCNTWTASSGLVA